MKKIIPAKLQIGDEVRIIAPSRSLSIISEENRKFANERLEEMGLKVTFGKHTEETDDFLSSSIESRISDWNEAFLDKSVKAIVTVIGGYNSNQLLRHFDWEIIMKNPKILCGFSDISALNNSVFTKTGLVTYSGPHYSTFSQKMYLDYTIEYFKKCLFSNDSFELEPSKKWSDDPWYKDQDNRQLQNNDGYLVINQGEAEGLILGANLCTLNLLQGSEYMPDLTGSILFIEDDEESSPPTFDRDLQSLIYQPGFDSVKGLVIGRFQKASKMSHELLLQIIKSKKELRNLPIIANADFGHTDPKFTFPIGGTVKIEASEIVNITIVEH